MSKLIVIVGVTGLQGSSVANTFLNLPGWKVRGISRNPSSPTAQALISKGAEIIQADLDDEKSLYPAFESANVIFSNTDFFGIFFHALMSKNDSPQQYAYDREVEQGINIARAAASPTVLRTLDRFVLSSLSDARKWSQGKYPNVYHNNSKIEIIQTIETQFPELAERMSMVQVGHYATNWKQSPSLAPQKQSDGSFIVKRTFTSDFKMPFVVPHKDTGEFVRALTLDLPAGTHILGASEILTLPEWTKIWAETLGVKAVFEQVTFDIFFQGVPDEMKRELSETFAYTNEFGYTGGDPAIKTAEQLGIKLSLTSMEEYIKGEDWSSVL
ncbi:hscarg dehydrogenase, putative [Talaromyces stipitatus ATCC 10500]|uniref:Hscarg dehydrogenase, putative n=1 Tax=Talaromyces stipitatus (strain ATCC 10500 / CBS 375.48 / QM 6759 / NRRL 1006) TaxID=441959 RepID=B8M8N2_TALSN|nr:hscarg dehydrogenase, putative [Talaromyces stipitatus ATCC 10500]EED20545.1 hscarg dehydrogenase, putative [Talaromyces stipitatus ATCC 10500]